MSIQLSDKQAKVLIQWWHALQPRDADDQENAKRCGPFLALGRGDRAALRRCGTLLQVMCEPAYVALTVRLDEERKLAPVPWKASGLALIAGLSVHVAAQGTEPVAALLGKSREGGDTPVMSRLRFEQLLRCEEEDELFLRMRRALDMIAGQPVLLQEMANDLLAWMAELHGELPPPAQRVRVRWATSYFSQALRKSAATKAKGQAKAAA